MHGNRYGGLIFALTVAWMDASQSLESDQLPESVTGGSSTDLDFPDQTGNFSKPWVPKCCNLNHGYTFENKSVCVPTEDEFLPDFEDWSNYSEIAKDLPVETRYEYFIGDPCDEEKYFLDPYEYSYDRYSLYSNGTLLYLDKLLKKDEFCTETLNNTIRIFVCFETEKKEQKLGFQFILYATGLLISIPFLLATAVVYLAVDLFRDLRGKSLACHVLCLASGYLALAVVQLASDELNEELCRAAGFFIQFVFVAAFFWLNVICYDTWQCINNDFRCTFKPTNLRSEKITFCKYSLYAWYGPFILSIVSLIMDLTPAIPESYLKPNFGLQSCWFYSDDAALPYFYGPVGIIILVNIIFFILSARKIYLEQKRRVEYIQNNLESVDITRDKTLSIRVYTNTLQECVYLFGIMGINWAAEVISWAVGGSFAIWLITDLFNALQGVLIFYLFVIKPISVRNEVRQKCRKTWYKIIKCDCRHEDEDEEENRRISRHWHANITSERAESCFDNENNKFLSLEKGVAV